MEDWYDLCMLREEDCWGGELGLLDVIRDRWEVCYAFTGWRASRVVGHGDGCL